LSLSMSQSSSCTVHPHGGGLVCPQAKQSQASLCPRVVQLGAAHRPPDCLVEARPAPRAIDRHLALPDRPNLSHPPPAVRETYPVGGDAREMETRSALCRSDMHVIPFGRVTEGPALTGKTSPALARVSGLPGPNPSVARGPGAYHVAGPTCVCATILLPASDVEPHRGPRQAFAGPTLDRMCPSLAPVSGSHRRQVVLRASRSGRSLPRICCATSIGESEGSVEMPRNKIDGETEDAAAKRDDELVSRAAKRTDWAGSALEGAAEDLDDVGEDDSTLTGLTESVQDEATRVARLAKDIERQVGGTETADRE
jgi:hypothetical protein